MLLATFNMTSVGACNVYRSQRLKSQTAVDERLGIVTPLDGQKKHQICWKHLEVQHFCGTRLEIRW